MIESSNWLLKCCRNSRYFSNGFLEKLFEDFQILHLHTKYSWIELSYATCLGLMCLNSLPLGVKYGFGMASEAMLYDQICIVGECGNKGRYIIGMCHCVDFMAGKELSLVTPTCNADNDDFSHLWMTLSTLWHTWKCMLFVKTLEQQYISNTWHFNYDQTKKLMSVMIQCDPPKKPICIGEPFPLGYCFCVWE